jgi:hypothetical protein
MVSETEALDKLLSLEVISSSVAEIIKPFAKDNRVSVACQNISEATMKVLILLFDKSGRMAPFSREIIDAQKCIIDYLSGVSTSSSLILGQLLFNQDIDCFQKLLPFRELTTTARVSSEIGLLDSSNLSISGRAAFYDSICSGVSMLLPLLVSAEEQGQQCWANLCVISQGIDTASETSLENCNKVIDYFRENGIIDTATIFKISENYLGVGKESIHLDVVDIKAGLDFRKRFRRSIEMHAVQAVI